MNHNSMSVWLLQICIIFYPAIGVASKTINVSVYGENGAPLDGVAVSGAFLQEVNDRTNSGIRTSRTGPDGKAVISGKEELYVDLTVIKEGYYESRKRVPVNKGNDINVDVLLRQKIEPISMYAKRMRVTFQSPGAGRYLNFFEGRSSIDAAGAHIAMELELNREGGQGYSHKVGLKFVNEHDGVAFADVRENWSESKYKTGYSAPETPYENSLTVLKNRVDGVGYSAVNLGVPFYMRLDTEIDQDGNVVSAKYCKVWPGFQLFGGLSDSPGIELTYYCNPVANSRNVEFDPERNMFENLTREEAVRRP